jgi:hypothetical protein
MTRGIFLLVLLLSAAQVHAETAYRWVDKDGTVHFSDHPPLSSPQAKRTTKKDYSGQDAPEPAMSYAMSKATTDFPLTIYTTSNCGAACDSGLKLLRERKLPFTQKDVKSTTEDIEAFKKATGQTDPSVPVLMVGSRVLKGFQAQEWADMLDLAGYPK